MLSRKKQHPRPLVSATDLSLFKKEMDDKTFAHFLELVGQYAEKSDFVENVISEMRRVYEEREFDIFSRKVCSEAYAAISAWEDEQGVPSTFSILLHYAIYGYGNRSNNQRRKQKMLPIPFF